MAEVTSAKQEGTMKSLSFIPPEAIVCSGCYTPNMKTVAKCLCGVVISTLIGLPSGTAFGQIFAVKDRNGVLVLTVGNVKMFRHSDYFKEDIPVFQGIVVNVSGARLLGVTVAGTVHKKDGTVVKFNLDGVCKSLPPCEFPKDFTHDAMYLFSQPWPVKPPEFDSVEFTLDTAQRLITEDGFHFAGFIARDEGCFNDYLTTQSLTGLILRKKLVELVEYGCGFIVEKPEAVFVGPKKTLGVGAKKVAAVLVDLGVYRENVLMGLKQQPYWFEAGWVQASALIPGPVLTTEEIGVLKK